MPYQLMVFCSLESKKYINGFIFYEGISSFWLCWNVPNWRLILVLTIPTRTLEMSPFPRNSILVDIKCLNSTIIQKSTHFWDLKFCLIILFIKLYLKNILLNRTEKSINILHTTVCETVFSVIMFLKSYKIAFKPHISINLINVHFCNLSSIINAIHSE